MLQLDSSESPPAAAYSFSNLWQVIRMIYSGIERESRNACRIVNIQGAVTRVRDNRSYCRLGDSCLNFVVKQHLNREGGWDDETTETLQKIVSTFLEDWLQGI